MPSAKLFSLCLLVLALFFATGAMAQIDTGAIVGTVTDSSGSVVPNAQVTATNVGTNQSISVQTNSQGQYVFTALRIGEYQVEVQAPGFRKTVRGGLTLNVQDRLGVDVVLQVGEVSQTVEVSSASPLLETQSADMGGVIQSRQVVDLPLNGRRYADLALLVPGVLPRPGTGNPSEARFNVNGNQSLQNYFALDGADNNVGGENVFAGTPEIIRPAPDALAEFKVQTRTFSAEFGSAMGAVINASLKSGTNSVHGDVYHFLRNSALDANDFFANRQGLKKGEYIQNQGGFTLGGPVYIPGVYDGRNKTFFFGDFAFLRIRQAQTMSATVPTPAMKNGDFTGLATLKDPGSIIPSEAGCTAGNVIQARCLDPVGQAYAKLYPDPTVAGPFTGNNFFTNVTIPTSQNQTDLKIDQRITGSDTFFARYSFFSPKTLDQAGAFANINPLSTGGFTDNLIGRSQQGVGSWTRVFTPALVNEARFSFSRQFGAETPISPPGSLASKIGLTNVPDTSFASGYPTMRPGGFPLLGTAEWRPQFEVAQVWQALDNLSYVKGTHQFKFGYEWKRYSQNTLDVKAFNGTMSVSNSFYVGGSTSYAAIANLLLGNVTSFGLSSPFVFHDYINGNSFYAQDTWRITRRLSLNYGVRYEYFTPWIERDNHTSNFSPANGGSMIVANSGGVASRALINPDKNNFAPRFGFAYNPWKRMTVRGGFGVFYQAYDRIGSESLNQLNPPQFIDRSVGTTSTAPPVFFLKNGYPNFAAPNLTDVNFLKTLQIRAQDPNQRTPYVEQISLSTEYQLTDSLVFEVSGVANYAHKLRKLRNLNQGIITGPATVVFPYLQTFGNGYIEYLASNGDSNFHALEMRLEKRYSKGLTLLASYTYSKALGDVLDNLSAGASGSIQVFPQNGLNYRLDYGPEAFDQRQRFVLSYSYDLPIGRGSSVLNSGPVGKILEKWSLNGLTSFNSGSALTATGSNNSNTNPNGGSNARGNCIGPVTTGGPLTAWVTKANTFASTTPFTFGSCGVGTFYGPGINNWDFSLFKKIPVRESKYFEYRAEFFNGWNHPQFVAPTTNVDSAAFGQISALQVKARQIQMALKFYF